MNIWCAKEAQSNLGGEKKGLTGYLGWTGKRSANQITDIGRTRAEFQPTKIRFRTPGGKH